MWHRLECLALKKRKHNPPPDFVRLLARVILRLRVRDHVGSVMVKDDWGDLSGQNEKMGYTEIQCNFRTLNTLRRLLRTWTEW